MMRYEIWDLNSEDRVVKTSVVSDIQGQYSLIEIKSQWIIYEFFYKKLY